MFVVFLLSGVRYIISGDMLYVKIWIIPGRSVRISGFAKMIDIYYLCRKKL